MEKIKMKTAVWTFNDIKTEDVNDMLISKNEKGELEFTLRSVSHINDKDVDVEADVDTSIKTTVTYGVLISLIVILFIAFVSFVTGEQEASLDRAIERMNENKAVSEQIEMERLAAREQEKEEFDNPIYYYYFDENGEIACTRDRELAFNHKVVADFVEEPRADKDTLAQPVSDKGSVKQETAKAKSSDKAIHKASMKIPPYVDSSFKAYMDYHTITDKSSKQYEMQQGAWTGMDGVRRIGDDICVAMGTYYTDGCGDRFEITLDTGKTFNVIVSDIKADKDTDETNRFTLHGEEQKACIIEFIVDVDELGDKSRLAGDVSYSNFAGEVTSIVKL